MELRKSTFRESNAYPSRHTSSPIPLEGSMRDQSPWRGDHSALSWLRLAMSSQMLRMPDTCQYYPAFQSARSLRISPSVPPPRSRIGTLMPCPSARLCGCSFCTFDPLIASFDQPGFRDRVLGGTDMDKRTRII